MANEADLLVYLRILMDPASRAALEAEARKYGVAAGEAAALGAGTGMDKLMSMAKRVGAAFGVAFGLKAIVDFGRASIKAADEAERAWLRLNSALEVAGLSMTQVKARLDPLLSSLSQRAKFAVDDLAGGLATLITQNGDYELSVRALDASTRIARAGHIDLASAVEIVGRALETGQMRALVPYIGKLKDGQMILEAIEQKYPDVTKVMTPFERATLSLSLVWRQLKEEVGRALITAADEGDVIPTFEGHVRDLTTWMKDHRQDIIAFEQALLSIATALTQVVMPAFMKSITGIAQWGTRWKIEFKEILDGWIRFQDVFGGGKTDPVVNNLRKWSERMGRDIDAAQADWFKKTGQRAMPTTVEELLEYNRAVEEEARRKKYGTTSLHGFAGRPGEAPSLHGFAGRPGEATTTTGRPDRPAGSGGGGEPKTPDWLTKLKLDLADALDEFDINVAGTREKLLAEMAKVEKALAGASAKTRKTFAEDFRDLEKGIKTGEDKINAAEQEAWKEREAIRRQAEDAIVASTMTAVDDMELAYKRLELQIRAAFGSNVPPEILKWLALQRKAIDDVRDAEKVAIGFERIRNQLAIETASDNAEALLAEFDALMLIKRALVEAMPADSAERLRGEAELQSLYKDREVIVQRILELQDGERRTVFATTAATDEQNKHLTTTADLWGDILGATGGALRSMADMLHTIGLINDDFRDTLSSVLNILDGVQRLLKALEAMKALGAAATIAGGGEGAGGGDAVAGAAGVAGAASGGGKLGGLAKIASKVAVVAAVVQIAAGVVGFVGGLFHRNKNPGRFKTNAKLAAAADAGSMDALEELWLLSGRADPKEGWATNEAREDAWAKLLAVLKKHPEWYNEYASQFDLVTEIESGAHLNLRDPEHSTTEGRDVTKGKPYTGPKGRTYGPAGTATAPAETETGSGQPSEGDRRRLENAILRGLGFGSFERGGILPHTGLFYGHMNELVLPARLTEELRSLARSGGSRAAGGGRNISVAIQQYGLMDREVPQRTIDAIRLAVGRDYQVQAGLQGNASIPS